MGKQEAVDRLEMAGDMVTNTFADFGVKLATAESAEERLAVFEETVEIMELVTQAFIAVRDELRKDVDESS